MLTGWGNKTRAEAADQVVENRATHMEGRQNETRALEPDTFDGQASVFRNFQLHFMANCGAMGAIVRRLEEASNSETTMFTSVRRPGEASRSRQFHHMLVHFAPMVPWRSLRTFLMVKRTKLGGDCTNGASGSPSPEGHSSSLFTCFL